MRVDAPFLSDPALIAVLDALESGGFHALPVGGCLRNTLLGHPVADVDIATDARPERVMELARDAGLKTVPTGIDHGTITVISAGRPFEVTTFRRDVETDGRHAVVAFSERIEDDAARRDFTMNALYCTRDGDLIDPIGGLPDVLARHLRFVGRAEDRITEDYLRILRFSRFLAWYGRDADADAVSACAALATGLKNISKERIGAEMRKLLAAENPAPAIALMAATGVLAHVLPGADPAAFSRLIALEDDMPPSWPRRLAALAAPATTLALRLSRDETRIQDLLSDALAADWSLNEAGFRLGAETAQDYALIRAARDMDDLPEDWRARIERAAAAALPIAAADLMPQLSGPALGRGLKAAEAAWIASDFAAPDPVLIDAALLAGSEDA